MTAPRHTLTIPTAYWKPASVFVLVLLSGVWAGPLPGQTQVIDPEAGPPAESVEASAQPEAPAQAEPDTPAAPLPEEQAAKAFADIETLYPFADRMEARDYSTLIFGPLNGFLRKYPDDPRAEEVRRLIILAEEERAKAEVGSRKVGGVWISAAEYRARLPELQAEDALKALQSLARTARPIDALNAFDRFEREHPTSASYAAAVQTALAVLPRLSGDLARLRREQPALLRRRMEEIRSAVNRSEVQQDFQRENAIIEGKREEARRAGQKWIEPHPVFTETLDETETLAAAERARLQSFRNEEHLALLAGIAGVEQKLEDGELLAAYTELNGIKPPSYLQPVYMELQDQLANRAAAAGIDLTPPPPPQPAAPAPAAGPALPLFALAALLAVFLAVILIVVLLRLRGRSPSA